MSPIKLNGSTSGFVALDAPAAAGSNTLVLPTGNGSADQALVTNGSGSLSWSDRGRMTLATAQNSTSGTAIDFTGIPSWAKRVTMMFNGVSTSGTSNLQIQLGISSGFDTTSTYVGATSYGGGGATTFNSTGFLLYNIMFAANTLSGSATITFLASNAWTLTGLLAMNTGNAPCFSAGSKTLSGTLDRVRITTVNGTDTFDAGSINILYEG